MDAAKVIRMSTNVPKVSYAVNLTQLSVSLPPMPTYSPVRLSKVPG